MKLIEFPIESHRFLMNVELDLRFEQILKSKILSPSLKTLMFESLEDSKLQVLLKTMLYKGEQAFFLPTYQERIVEEINLIRQHPDFKHMWDYFLVLEDIAHYFEKQDRIMNFGRGNSGGSLINYLLGITKIDPIDHDLLFERWFNLKSFPDISLDMAPEDVEQVRGYLASKYGSMFQRVQTQRFPRLKVAIRDILFGQTRSYIDSFVRVVDQFNSFRTMPAFKERLKTEQEFFLFICENHDGWRGYFNQQRKDDVLSILNTSKGLTSHISEFILSDSNPELESVNMLGVVKIGLIGMNGYAALNKQLALSSTGNVPISQEGFDRVLASKDTGLFSYAREFYNCMLSTKAPISSITDMGALIAKTRPSMGFVVNLLHCPVNNDMVGEILKDTHGELIFQEQVVLILQRVFDLEKQKSVEIFKGMVKNSAEYQLDRVHLVKQNKEITEFLEHLAPFLFSKAHAVCLASSEYLRYNT